MLVQADVAAPHHEGAPLTQGTGEPGRLRVVEEDHVAGPHPVDHLLALLRQRGVVRRPRGGVEPPASPGTPCNLLWIRLVTAKNSGSPPTTSQRMSTPVPAA